MQSSQAPPLALPGEGYLLNPSQLVWALKLIFWRRLLLLLISIHQISYYPGMFIQEVFRLRVTQF